MSAPRPKPVRCWAVVGRKNYLFLFTISAFRKDAVAKFVEAWLDGWPAAQRDGYRVIRCTLVPEQADAA